MCMWEDGTKSVLQEMRTAVGDLNLSPNILTVTSSRNTYRTCGMRDNKENFITHLNLKQEKKTSSGTS